MKTKAIIKDIKQMFNGYDLDAVYEKAKKQLLTTMQKTHNSCIQSVTQAEIKEACTCYDIIRLINLKKSLEE